MPFEAVRRRQLAILLIREMIVALGWNLIGTEGLVSES
jgi:hypothetical protein